MASGFGTKYGVQPPSSADIVRIAALYNIELSAGDVRFFESVFEGFVASYRSLVPLPDPGPEVTIPRVPGERPSTDTNPYGAWAWRCSIKGDQSGILSGKKVALNDNISVAGVPMSSGSAVIDGFISDFDATLVTRILAAGGEIVGKAVCEDHGLPRLSSTAFSGRVLNPHDPLRSAGGASSGCAALIAGGSVEMAIGADQGGDIRIPSSLCGVYGLKPTYGLVPYTGILPLETTLDHTGPMGQTTDDLALLLEAVAGPDSLDPRQSLSMPTAQYSTALTGNIKDLKFGVVSEGFGWSESDKVVDAAVKEAASKFSELGAIVREVSIPEHRQAPVIFDPYFIDGVQAQVWGSNVFGTGWQGYYPTRLIDFYGKSRKSMADGYSDPIKTLIVLGHYMNSHYNGRFYAKAQNMVGVLKDAYRKAMGRIDILIMPATPRRAAPFPDSKADSLEYIAATRHLHLNTCAFNMTGNPALNLPCAEVDLLPIGMQLVGRPFEEAKLLRASHAFEGLGVYSVRDAATLRY